MTTRQTRLEEAIMDTKIKKSLIAEALGITGSSISNKISGRQDFTELEKKEVLRVINGVRTLLNPEAKTLTNEDIF